MPYTNALKFVLKHIHRHGDNPASKQAQQHLDAIEKHEAEDAGFDEPVTPLPVALKEIPPAK
jgi:hypothetical protein